jgi:hypothetical protein
MAERVVLQDGSELDMLDPASIRAYVRRTLALNAEPTAPQLRRLEMLAEHAEQLERQQKPAQRPRMTAAEAAAELRRRIEAGESR